MPARFHVDLPLFPGQSLPLPPSAARHLQVLRMQPGDPLQVFDGSGHEWAAQVVAMGRSTVEVKILAAHEPLPELPCAVTLAVGMPANERMDALVEKATELGVAAIQPLICERSVLRLNGERADRKRAHWQAVAVSASEQSGRATVPLIAPIRSLPAWLAGLATTGEQRAPAAGYRGLLSLRSDARPLGRWLNAASPLPQRLLFLNGPEGGLSDAEENLARDSGFDAVGLGPRVLRADTAPLAALAWIGLLADAA
ncbi:16S rRNA (uracil(1498)-N(3))-methyltransferase [Piscinibacter sakaiensis]|uniref:16S rRNA (uracil(1498)-N(3))-methyltransferase n=1 Tax=Piscinibacter sakaiensis TaxID=1547922 RepID=UPI003AAC869D